MANSWNIPDWLEREVIERDQDCVYCHVDFSIEHTTRKTIPTWEHIVNDARIVTRENIARCCSSCNASKGARDLADWLESSYCERNGITRDSVADVVKRALANPPEVPRGAGSS
ncbi:HNH endonuclease [Seongchinamella sediminis]|uniref:HNH endonuclease n=1 Tax=Seongchinamella sediminis TaxID=2283635 RepID=A0A3L7DTR8_9GAMM|nr:HNH endonuclease [Seongchinamella sediminis]